MIIFFNKETGKIEGTIEGRVHSEAQMRMWIGDPSKNDRIIVTWKPVKYFDQDGNEVGKEDLDADGKRLAFTADFEADHEQKDLLENFHKKPDDPTRERIRDYKINLKTKKLVKVNKDGKNK